MNKTYPTLYLKDSKGSTRIWFLEQQDNAYRTIAGLIDGQQVTSEWTRVEGKNIGKANQTNPTEQATSEIESKYTKQLKTGYFEDIADIDKELYISPMLAKNFIDRLDKIVYPVLVDIKYNGGRVVSSAAGQFSRKGELYHNIPHLQESLDFLFKKYPAMFTDGEGYNHEYRYKLNLIMKLLRKSVNVTPETLKESRDKVKYYIYDGYGFGNVTKDTKQFERRAALIKLLQDIPHIVPVVGKIAENEKEVWKIYQEYVDDGYEGAIVREDEKYVHNRASCLLKVKPEDTDEGIIVDIQEGDGNWSGTGKVITFRWKDKEFNGTFKGDRPRCIQFLKDKKQWIGREVQFAYNGLTGLGTPNFARMDIDNWTPEK